MEFELDKHDLFRNVVPGFIFLLVLFSFYLFANNFILDPKDNISSYLSIMAIALTLPIGYLIHNIYRSVHIWSGEQAEWEGFEAKRIKAIIGTSKLAGLENEPVGEENKLLSWFLEAILHEKENEAIKERGYTLISRIHSSGSGIFSIILGNIFCSFYFFYIKSNCICPFIPLILGWIFVVVCLWNARDNAIKGHKSMIKHFVNSEEIKAIIMKKAQIPEKENGPLKGTGQGSDCQTNP